MIATSTVTPITENPKQPQQRQTAKDIIAANVKSLIEQLEAGHSDALTAYLDAMRHPFGFSHSLIPLRLPAPARRLRGRRRSPFCTFPVSGLRRSSAVNDVDED